MEMAKKATEKEAFLLRKSVLDAIESFPDDVKLKLARLLFQYGITGSHDPCDEVVIAALRPMKVAIDSEKNRYYNKQLVNCFSRAAKAQQMNATLDSYKKQYADTEKALQRVYSEVTHHDIPDIRISILRAIGFEMWKALAPQVYLPKAVKQHFEHMGIEFVVKETQLSSVSQRPQLRNDPSFFNIQNRGRI